MTYETRITEFEGFPVPYDPDDDLVMDLNRTIFGVNNGMLQDIGRAVSKDAEHLYHPSSDSEHLYSPKTTDNYDWFTGLIFTLRRLRGNARVAVLFPYFQDLGKGNPETQMERSINVHIDKELPRRVVRGLLKKIIHQVIAFKLKKREEINDLRGIPP